MPQARGLTKPTRFHSTKQERAEIVRGLTSEPNFPWVVMTLSNTLVYGNFNRTHKEAEKQVGINSKGFLKFFDCPGSRQGVEDLKEVGINSKGFLKFFDCPGSRQGVEDLKEVSNDDIAVAQRRLEDKQPEKRTNTKCLVKEQEKVHHGTDVGAVIMKTRIPGQEGAKANVAERYREDGNEAPFAVDKVEKIYAYESLTFIDTIACEVISKWKAGLQEDMDVRSDVDQSGNTLRVSQSRIYNEKLVQTLLKGHSTLSLDDSLLRDCDVEKNGSGYELRLVAGTTTGRAEVEEDDRERAHFLGGKISLERKKYQELNIGDSGNTGDRRKIVGGAIGVYGRIGEMASEAKRYLDKSSEGLGEVFLVEAGE
nr:zinc finger, CCHC-type [Tanacetum cinerariifolium]